MAMLRAKAIATLSLGCLVLGVVCILFVGFVPAFAPCFVFHVSRAPVQDTFLCRSAMTLGYVGFSLLVIGGVAILVAACLGIKSWLSHHARRVT